jgi:hypothetical protein
MRVSSCSGNVARAEEMADVAGRRSATDSPSLFRVPNPPDCLVFASRKKAGPSAQLLKFRSSDPEQ